MNLLMKTFDTDGSRHCRAYFDNFESFFELIDAARNKDNVGALEGQQLRS